MQLWQSEKKLWLLEEGPVREPVLELGLRNHVGHGFGDLPAPPECPK